MFDTLLGAVTSNPAVIVGGGASAVVLWVLKKVPNEHICGVIETTFESLGKVMTLGLAKWKFSAKIWNQTIEPYFVDLLNNTVKAALDGFIDGLKSD